MNNRNLLTKTFARDATAILVLAVLVRLVFAITSGANPSERRIADDSRGYLELGQNLNKGLGFGRHFDTNDLPASVQASVAQTNSAQTGIWVPEFCRTPGYPWIISVSASTPDRVAGAVVVLQQIIELMICFTVFTVCYLVFGRFAGIIAGVLSALDLQGITMSNIVFTETTFTLCVVAAAFAASHLLRKRGVVWAAITGLLLAASMLIRPTTLYLPVFIVLFLIFSAVRQRRWIHLATAVVLFGMAYLPIVGWMARNKAQCGKFALTSMTQGGSLMPASAVLAKAKGISDSAALNEICDGIGLPAWRIRMVPISAEENKRIVAATAPIMREHRGMLLKEYVVRSANLLVGPEKYMLQVLGMPSISFGLIAKGKGANPSGTGLGLVVLGIQVLLTLVVYAGVLRTLFQAWKGKVFPPWVWAGFWFAAYTLALSAAVCVGDPRYRAPVYPLLIIVAAASFARPRATPSAGMSQDAEKTSAMAAR